ncbi:MAG: NADH-quinone oxidoreductase subunit N [Acidimicrobiia bacterium]
MMILAQAQLVFPQVSWMAIAPELVLSLGAALILLIDVQWKPKTPRPLGIAFAVIILAALAFSVAQWIRLDTIPRDERFPFAGMIVVDGFGVLARSILFVVTGLAVAIGWNLFERLGRRAAEALALVALAAAGFSIMAVSLHLMLMFLGLEIGSIALYILAGITREHSESDEAAIKYFLLGSVASAIFIYGVALTFAGTGELNVLEQARFMAENILFAPGVVLIGVALMVIGLAFKVSAAPFHSWAPDVYQGAPAGAVGFMAAAAKVGAFVALWRILGIGFPSLDDTWAPVIAAMAALSMLVGAVLAVVQDDVRRMLAYSGVAHAGFILTGILSGPEGIRGVWFYLAVYTLQLVGAFGVVAAVSGASGSRSAIAAFAGLGRRQPVLALVFSTLLLGMAGLPLTSGFIAKFGVFQDAWQAGFEWLVIVAVLTSVIGFFFYLRVIVAMYMQEPEGEQLPTPGIVARSALALVAVATIVFGVLPAPLLELAGDALSR